MYMYVALSRHLALGYVAPHCVTLKFVVSRQVALCYVVSHCITLRHIASRHVTSRCVALRRPLYMYMYVTLCSV